MSLSKLNSLEGPFLFFQEKHDRLKTLKRLRTEETYLCDRLVMPQHDLNFIGCPSLDQLRELEQNVKFLKAEKVGYRYII